MNSFENPSLDVVHLRKLIELEQVLGSGALPELLEVRLNFGAVVGFAPIGRNGDEAVPDQEAVADRSQIGFESGRVLNHSLEKRGGDIGREISEEAGEAG